MESTPEDMNTIVPENDPAATETTEETVEDASTANEVNDDPERKDNTPEETGESEERLSMPFMEAPDESNNTDDKNIPALKKKVDTVKDTEMPTADTTKETKEDSTPVDQTRGWVCLFSTFPVT